MIGLGARVVFDCNVLLQAAARPDGPAGMCFRAALQQRITLVCSSGIVDEFMRVAHRPQVAAKLGITEGAAAEFAGLLRAVALWWISRRACSPIPRTLTTACISTWRSRLTPRWLCLVTRTCCGWWTRPRWLEETSWCVFRVWKF